MAKFASARAAADRNDLSVPKGAPVRGSLYDADAFGRFSEAWPGSSAPASTCSARRCS